MDELQQPMPATEAALVLARALAKVDHISPKTIVEPTRYLLETALQATVGVPAKKELPQGVLRALAIAQGLVDAPPEPGAGVFSDTGR